MILEQLQRMGMNGETKDELNEDGEDEVSLYFYGNGCNCGKTAKCKSAKCICYVRETKCNVECHADQEKHNCANK